MVILFLGRWTLFDLEIIGGRSHVTDATNASRTMLFNIKDYKWDEEICDLMNIPIKMLPKVLILRFFWRSR